eukprot:gene3896-biopygen9585
MDSRATVEAMSYCSQSVGFPSAPASEGAGCEKREGVWNSRRSTLYVAARLTRFRRQTRRSSAEPAGRRECHTQRESVLTTANAHSQAALSGAAYRVDANLFTTLSIATGAWR